MRYFVVRKHNKRCAERISGGGQVKADRRERGFTNRKPQVRAGFIRLFFCLFLSRYNNGLIDRPLMFLFNRVCEKCYQPEYGLVRVTMRAVSMSMIQFFGCSIPNFQYFT